MSAVVRIFQVGLLRIISLTYGFFRRFFTWIALGDVNLRVLLALVRKRNFVEEETRGAA